MAILTLGHTRVSAGNDKNCAITTMSQRNEKNPALILVGKLEIVSLCIGLECSPMARETWVQSQVASYQRLKKWYLMPPCLTLSIIRYGSRVKLSNPGKGVAPSPTHWCSSYRKGSLRVTLDYGRQLYFTYIYIYILYIYIYIYILGQGLSKNYVIKASHEKGEVCPRGLMVKALDCRIVVSEFEYPVPL